MKQRAAAMAMLCLAITTITGQPAFAQASGGRIYRLGHLSLTTSSAALSERETLPALAKLGFASGRNLVFDARTGNAELLPSMARELVATQPDVIIAIGGESLHSAATATQSIPIIVYGADPVGQGFAQSLSRPGGNVTGVVILSSELDAKRLDLLHEAVPAIRRVGALHYSQSTTRPTSQRSMDSVAQRTGLELVHFDAAGPDGYPAAFAAMRQAGVEAVVIAANSLLFRDTAQLTALAREARLPTMCEWSAMAHAGCLLAYGPNQLEMRRQLATYVAKVLRGASPAELPIEQPRTYEFAVNLATAKALGLTMSQSLLIRADEVLE